MFYIKNRKKYSMKKILRIDLEYNWVFRESTTQNNITES